MKTAAMHGFKRGHQMDGLTFTVELVNALAWPAAAVVITFAFHKQIRTLLDRMRRGKFAGAEFEFEEQMLALSVQTPKQDPIPGPPADPNMVALAITAPRAAILQTWLRLEAAAANRIPALSRMALEQRPRSSYSLRSILPSLSTDDAALFLELHALRNQAVHNVDFNPSIQSVLQFMELADGLRKRIETETQKTEVTSP